MNCESTPYQCGQCRIYNHPEMQALGLIYLGLRELPLILFALKTLRVCVCFLDYKTVELPAFLKRLFGKETTIVLVSAVYSILVSLGNFVDMSIGACSFT
jgi:hypothetical protein